MGELQIIPFPDGVKWNNIVSSFDRHDVYYLNEYVSAFRYTHDGTPLLIYYCSDKMRLCYVVQERDIALDPKFAGLLEQGRYCDWSTPYGYGGPLTDGVDEGEMTEFFRALQGYCSSNGIVSQFIRFHPLLQNQTLFQEECELRRLKNTVYIDMQDRNGILHGMDPKCRNMIRKAEKNGIQIIIDNSKEVRYSFMEMYRITMERNLASDYYFFNQNFFEELFSALEKNYTLFSAINDGEIISSAIMLHGNGTMHYHLSAARREHMHLAPNNLLIYTAACWGADHGYTRFHLGGGVAAEDKLLSFKKSFNKTGLIDFYIGRNVFCEESYTKLMAIRLAFDPGFNPENNHMIQYRS